MTLYLKYRPQIINELDLKAVRESLEKIAASKEKPHAFLFSGPRGAGKTSAARILAKVLNCTDIKDKEPCNKCDQCVSITKGQNIDVLEMDAASNRGIDDIRALREKVGLSSSLAKKKIYIIDEVHMLTTEAANALLKTLEEPPSHVTFILATTDPHKLPETVRSRLTTIKFTKAQKEEIERMLERVVKGEKLKTEKGVLAEIAKHCDGSFRDAVKALEELCIDKKAITLEAAMDHLNMAKNFNPKDFTLLLFGGKAKECLEIINQSVDEGATVVAMIDSLMEYLRENLLSDQKVESGKLIKMLDLLIEARSNLANTAIPQLPLELAVLKWEGPRREEKEELKVAEVKVKVKKKASRELDSSVWTRILTSLRDKNASLETLLRSAKILAYDGKNLDLGIFYQFHKERLENVKNTLLIENICGEMMGSSVKVNFYLTEKSELPPPKPDISSLTEVEETDIIQAAQEIFGG